MLWDVLWENLLSHSCPKLLSFTTWGFPISARTRTHDVWFFWSWSEIACICTQLNWFDFTTSFTVTQYLHFCLINICWPFLCGLPYAVNKIWREYNYPCLEGILRSTRPVSLRRKVALPSPFYSNWILNSFLIHWLNSSFLNTGNISFFIFSGV